MTVQCYESRQVTQIQSENRNLPEFKVPKITVVVVTFNRPIQVKRTIESLIGQSVKPYEIIVIDDGSQPKLDLTTNFEGVQFIRLDQEIGLSNSRNLGISTAKGEYVAFIDDDAVASPNWLEEIGKAILTGAEILGGPLVPNFEAEPPQWWTEKEYGGIVGIGNIAVEEIWGANMVLNKDIFKEIGLFNPRVGRQKGTLMTREENDLIDRAKSAYKVAFVPSAVVVHSVSAKRLNLKYILRWRYYDGVSYRKLEKQTLTETGRQGVHLLANTALFLKHTMTGNRKKRIRFLSGMAYRLGRII